MFVQVIKGQVRDREGVEALGNRWQAELRPGAAGFLGATIGLTDDGTLLNLARFESRETAMANSARPEQGAWWAEFEACFEAPPTVRDSEDVTVYERGALDGAGFVQVMEGRLHDVERARAFERDSQAVLAAARPDLLGEVVVVHHDATFTQAAYFVSEEAARAGEAKEPTAEMSAAMEQMGDLLAIEEFFDLRRLWLS